MMPGHGCHLSTCGSPAAFPSPAPCGPLPQAAPPGQPVRRRGPPLGRLRVAGHTSRRKVYVHASQSDVRPTQAEKLLSRDGESPPARIAGHKICRTVLLGPWPGSVYEQSIGAGAEAIRGRGRAVETWRPPPTSWPHRTPPPSRGLDDGIPFRCGEGGRISAPRAVSSARAHDQRSAARDDKHQPCHRVPDAPSHPKIATRISPRPPARTWPVHPDFMAPA
jgi:hypothetical protein